MIEGDISRMKALLHFLLFDTENGHSQPIVGGCLETAPQTLEYSTGKVQQIQYLPQ